MPTARKQYEVVSVSLPRDLVKRPDPQDAAQPSHH
jgi:hypothetical protein